MADQTKKSFWLGEHPCTTLGIALALAFVLGMKEVRALFTDLPRVTWSESGMMGLGLWLYVLLLVCGYLVTLVALVRSSRVDAGGETSRVSRVIGDFATRLFIQPVKRLTKSQRRLLGGLLAAVGLALSGTGAWNKGPGMLCWECSSS